jgi:hypothetical protein
VQAIAQGAEGCDLARVLFCPRARNLWPLEGRVTCCALGVLGVRGPGAPLTPSSDEDHTGTERGYSRTCRRSRRGRKAATWRASFSAAGLPRHLPADTHTGHRHTHTHIHTYTHTHIHTYTHIHAHTHTYS